MLTRFQTEHELKSQAEISEQVDTIVSRFLIEASNTIPDLFLLQIDMDARKGIQESLKKILIEQASRFRERGSSLCDELMKGKYDNIIFVTPTLTPEIQILIKKFNREFVQQLFFKCNSEDVLNFWFQHTTLPQDALALVISLGCNKHALNYLKNRGLLEPLKTLSSTEKKELLARAKRFEKTEGFPILYDSLQIPCVATERLGYTQ